MYGRHIEWEWLAALLPLGAEFGLVAPELTELHVVSRSVVAECVVIQLGPVRIVGEVLVVCNSDDGLEGVSVFVGDVPESLRDRVRMIGSLLGGAEDEPVEGERASLAVLPEQRQDVTVLVQDDELVRVDDGDPAGEGATVR